MPTGKTGHFATATKALSLFKHAAKPKSHSELVRQSCEILKPLSARSTQPSDKALDDVERLLEEMVLRLYGDSDVHPNPDEVAALTSEIFKGEFLPALIRAVPLLKDSSRQPAVQIVASVQSHSRQAASQYLSAHTDVLDLMLLGYQDADVALFYGSMLRDCLRHQEAARHVLHSALFLSLFKHMEAPQFEIASDAAATLRELLLRHKSTAAEFLVSNHQQFFLEYNKLLESETYVTRRTAAKLLADMLLDRAYASVLARYVTDSTNLRPIMNLLKDSRRTIQLDGCQIFKAIAMHPEKSLEIKHILASNKDKLQRVLLPLKLEKGSDAEMNQFDKEKQDLLLAIQSL